MVLFRGFDFTLDVLPAADKVVVDGGWPGEHHGGEDDAGGPVDVEGGLCVRLQVPGHHHDAGLQDQLTRGLGQGPQAGQHSMS